MSETCCCKLFPTECEAGGIVLLGDGIRLYVKAVLVIMFEGFPNRFFLVGVFPSRRYCLILSGSFHAEPEIETFWH